MESQEGEGWGAGDINIQPWEEGPKWSKRQTGQSQALPDSICQIQTAQEPRVPEPCSSCV